MRSSRLTPKQQLFVQEYLVDRNAKQAVIRAGYAAGSAEVQGSRLLRNAKVRAVIDHLVGEQAQRLKITSDKVLQAIAEIAFADIRSIFDGSGRLLLPEHWTDDVAAGIAALELTRPSTLQRSRLTTGCARLTCWLGTWGSTGIART
jgi:phage terminase small subunit